MAGKGPGKNHRQGLTILELTRMFPDEDSAREWIEKIRWPNGPICPRCDSDNVQHPVTHSTMTHRCRSCRKWFTVRTGTPMQASNLGLQTWVIAIYLLNTELKGRASMKLHRDLGITQKSAWHLAHRIRESWDKKGNESFSGPVEADETYIGGKRKNMHAKKRRELTGRGTAGKAIVAGVKDRDTGKVVARVVPDTAAWTLQGFVGETTDRAATVYTDESTSYAGIDRPHETVKHSTGEYVRGMASTNGLESFWATLKRGYQGTFHYMSEKHLDRYVNEFSGRHNDRDMDTIDMMAETVVNMEGKRLRYKDLIAD